MEHDYGTPDERKAVREALIALRAFNGKLAACQHLGVTWSLSPKPQGAAGYNIDFKRIVTILPEQDEPR